MQELQHSTTSLRAAASQAPVGTCPTPGDLALHALGQLPRPQGQAIQLHVAACRDCKEMRHKLAETMAHATGRLIYKRFLHWLFDRAWLESHKKYLLPDGYGHDSKTRIIDRRFALCEFSKPARKLSGSTAECGVQAGVGSAMICSTLAGTYRPGEVHFGFDSFEGLSEPDDADKTEFAWQHRGALAIGPELAQKTLADFPFCKLVKGWIPETLSVAADHRFRLVHLDLDLHQPTLDSLAFFYPRMNPGGMFIFDDYGFLSCLGVRAAVDEFFADKPETVIETVTGQAVAYKL